MRSQKSSSLEAYKDPKRPQGIGKQPGFPQALFLYAGAHRGQDGVEGRSLKNRREEGMEVVPQPSVVRKRSGPDPVRLSWGIRPGLEMRSCCVRSSEKLCVVH